MQKKVFTNSLYNGRAKSSKRQTPNKYQIGRDITNGSSNGEEDGEALVVERLSDERERVEGYERRGSHPDGATAPDADSVHLSQRVTDGSPSNVRGACAESAVCAGSAVCAETAVTQSPMVCPHH